MRQACKPAGQLADLLAAAPDPVLHLQPLSTVSATTLVRDTRGDASDEFCDTCLRATGRNPFLLLAYLAELGDREPDTITEFGPDAVAAVFGQQVARLPTATKRVLRAVAVLGADADIRRVSAITAASVTEAVAALDALRAARILVPDGPYEFTHPIVQAAVVSAIPPGERALAHATAAAMLNAEAADPDRVATHLLLAEPSGETWRVRALQQAARSAARRGATPSAERYLRRALAEPPTAADGPAVELALAELAIARRDPAAAHQLAAAVAATPPGPARARAALKAARACTAASAFTEAWEATRAG